MQYNWNFPYQGVWFCLKWQTEKQLTWTGRVGHTEMEKYSAREKTREVQKKREGKQAKIWKHEVKRMKKGQAGSKEKFSRWIGQCSQKEQVRRKSIISGGEG